MFCERRMIKDSIVPAGMPTMVPILTYGAIKKSPIQIPPSFVNSMKVFGLNNRGIDCVEVFVSPRSSVYVNITFTGIVYSVVTFSTGVINSAEIV